MSYELSLEKSDHSLNTFEMSVEKASYNSDVQNYRIAFNTPNSQVDRHLEAQVQIEMPSSERQSLKAEIRSPWIRYSVEAQVKNDQKEQSLLLDVNRDGRKQFGLDLGLEVTQRGQKREFRPRLNLQMGPQSETIAMTGQVAVSKGRKNQLYFNLEGNQKQFLKGSLVREGECRESTVF